MKIISAPPYCAAETAEIARRLGQILAGLAALVARRFLKMPHLVGLTVLLWGRLGRMARRFERMVTRPAGVRRVRTRRAPGGGARPLAVPQGRGWLVRELGYEAAGYGCQLEALLADPAMQAALRALPGLGRIMRPLCRMLAVKIAEPAAMLEVPPAPAPRYWKLPDQQDAAADPVLGLFFAKSA